MTINWDGFIMGVSDYGLERMKEERALKMQERLAELEEKYKIAGEERKRKTELRNVAGTRQSPDNPEMEEDFNIEGQAINTRRRGAASIESEAQTRAKHEADLRNIDSQIQHRKDSIGVQREANGVRATSSLDGSGGGAAPTSDEGKVEALANQVLSNFGFGDIRPDTPEAFQNMGRVRQLARQAAWSAVLAGNPDLASEMFDKAMSTNSGFTRPPQWGE